MKSFYDHYTAMLREQGPMPGQPVAPVQPQQAQQPQQPQQNNAVAPPEGVDPNIQMIQQTIAKLPDANPAYKQLKGELNQILVKNQKNQMQKPRMVAQPAAQPAQPAAQPQQPAR